MEEKTGLSVGIVVGIVIGIVIAYFMFGGSGKYEELTAEDWFNSYEEEVAVNDELQTKVDDYQAALEEANSNIDQANSSIENAKLYAWEDYDSMGDAIDSLETVDNVSESY